MNKLYEIQVRNVLVQQEKNLAFLVKQVSLVALHSDKIRQFFLHKSAAWELNFCCATKKFKPIININEHLQGGPYILFEYLTNLLD